MEYDKQMRVYPFRGTPHLLSDVEGSRRPPVVGNISLSRYANGYSFLPDAEWDGYHVGIPMHHFPVGNPDTGAEKGDELLACPEWALD